MTQRPLIGFNALGALQQFDAGRKQAQERSQLEALANVAQQIEQGADMRTVAPELLRAGDRQGFSRLVQLANQDRSFNANQEQRGINNAFRDKSFDATQEQRGIQNNLARSRLNQSASQFDRRMSQNRAQFDQRLNLQRQGLDLRKSLAEQARADKQAKAQAKANKPVKLTEGQADSVKYRNRAMEANRILSNPKVTAAMQDLGDRFLADAAGKFNLRPYAASVELQKGEQAQRDFINAILRDESGAVISDSEFENARLQYFPLPGEPPEVVAQKARNRLEAIRGLNIASGPLRDKEKPKEQPQNQQPGSTKTGINFKVVQ